MLNKILNHFGKENQQDKLKEEVMELVKSVIKYTDDPNEDAFKELLSELADVTILTEQLGYTEGIPQYKFHRMLYTEKDNKIKRTISIIEEMQKTGKSYKEIRKDY